VVVEWTEWISCGGLPKPVVLRCPAHLLEEPDHSDHSPHTEQCKHQSVELVPRPQGVDGYEENHRIRKRKRQSFPSGMWIHAERAPPARICVIRVVPALYRPLA